MSLVIGLAVRLLFSTEIDVTRKLEALRVARGILDISFDSIVGAGPHGAIIIGFPVIFLDTASDTNRGHRSERWRIPPLRLFMVERGLDKQRRIERC